MRCSPVPSTSSKRTPARAARRGYFKSSSGWSPNPAVLPPVQTTPPHQAADLPLRMDHRLGAADDEGLVPFEEVGRHLREGLGPLGADRVPGIIDENQVTIWQKLLVEAAHL